MPRYSKDDVVLARYPFSDLSSAKVRPAAVVSAAHSSADLIIVPLTSKTKSLLAGEFVLSNWSGAGLNIDTAAKRGIYTVHESLIVKKVGRLEIVDAETLRESLRTWLALS